MSATAIHPNSVHAYATTEAQRSTNKEQIKLLMGDFRPRTDREIGKWLECIGCKAEQYRARINELLDEGWLKEENITVICKTTNRPVRVTRRAI